MDIEGGQAWFLRLLALPASTLGVDVRFVVHLAIRPLDADGLFVCRKQERCGQGVV
jgi:hypothetical protein